MEITMEITMPIESELERLDQKIKEYSQQSVVAPPEFINAELRRFVNKDLLAYHSSFSSWRKRRWVPDDNYLKHFTRELEQEFQCYFEKDKFVEKRDLDSYYFWKSIYGASSAQVEHFVVDEGLNEIVYSLDFGKSEKVIRCQNFSSKEGKKPSQKLYLFLIQNGYLFPQSEKKSIVHTNLLKAHAGILRNSGDTPFLTRDLGRCPYINNAYYDPLTAEESWKYWKDLVALAMSLLPSHILYLSDHFQGKEHFRDCVQPCLELGRKLVPQRYVELEPKIENFEWVIPQSKD